MEALCILLVAACGELAAPEAVDPGTVGPVTVASIDVEPGDASLNVADTIGFEARPRDAAGRPVEAKISWTASGGSIDASGRYVAGDEPGDFLVMARSGAHWATARVTVKQRPDHAGPKDKNEDESSPPSDDDGSSSDDGLEFDVALDPGEDIQAAVQANPAGTVYLVRTGRHVRQTVVPKDRDVFVGEAGAVLDGEDVTKFAFKGAARDVVLRDLEITGYVAHDSALGAIQGHDARGWRLENLDVHHNRAHGVNLRDSVTVIGGSYHHNGRIGIVVAQGEGVVIDGAELAFNNHERRFDPLWAAGGIKIANSKHVVVRNCHVHDNVGPGIWYDVNARGGQVLGNVVEANRYAGIFYEISYDGVIDGNTVIGNGTDTDGVHGSGILISESPNAVVEGNVVLDNAHGIVLKQNHRVSGQYGSLRVRDVSVRGNVVRPGDGASGLLDVIGDGAIFEANNRFDRNEYHLGGNSRPFWGPGGRISVDDWLATGQDADSEFHQ